MFVFSCFNWSYWLCQADPEPAASALAHLLYFTSPQTWHHSFSKHINTVFCPAHKPISSQVMKLLFTSLPPRNGHMLFCDGNFCKPNKCDLLCVLIHIAVQLESNKMLTNRGDRVTIHRFAKAAEWGVFGAEDRRFWRSLCGPEKNTWTLSSQIIRWSFSCQCQTVPWSLKRKANLHPERGVIRGCMSAPSKHHISLVYGAAAHRGEHLNAPVLKFHIAEGLFLFHSTPHISCATRLLRIFHTTLQLWAGAHIKVQRDVKMKSSRCSLLWYYKLLLASHTCILLNFNSCYRGFTHGFKRRVCTR